MSLTINVQKDTATPTMNRLRASLSPRRLAAAIGPACARLTQQHLRGLGTNKRGWPTTNFWARAAKATSWQTTQEGTVVSINQIGVRQRFYGGAIAPVKKSMLAIPISPVSYGHVPADFQNLFVLRTPKGVYLVQGGVTGGGTKAAQGQVKRGMGGNAKHRKNAALNFLFKLSPSVLQGPDPGVLPDVDQFRSVANKAVLAAVIKRNESEG
jgi:hypothetical protein